MQVVQKASDVGKFLNRQIGISQIREVDAVEWIGRADCDDKRLAVHEADSVRIFSDTLDFDHRCLLNDLAKRQGVG